MFHSKNLVDEPTLGVPEGAGCLFTGNCLEPIKPGFVVPDSIIRFRLFTAYCKQIQLGSIREL